MSSNTADCIAVVGASGTGKGLYCDARIRPLLGTRPVLVWSPLELTDRYARKFGGVIVRTFKQLGAQLGCARAVVFVPSDQPKVLAEQFNAFCRIAWHVKGGLVLVEELSRVTSPSYAPPPWQNLSTAGRHQGLTVIATAQRPAQIDKDFLGNCTEVRAYRVNYENDARNLASAMREPIEVFLELPDRHYVHRWIRERRNERGVQPLPGAAVTAPQVRPPGRTRKRSRLA